MGDPTARGDTGSDGETGLGRLRGAQFGQHPVRRLGMKEGDQLASCAVKWLLVDQAHAGSGGLRELAGDVVGPESDVVDAFTPVSQELGDRALGRGWLQEFQMDAADVEKRRAHLLGGDLLAVLTAQSKRLFINGYRLVERANRDAKVVYLLNHFL